VTRYAGTDEFRRAEFVDLDMAGSVFREVDLSGARLYGVLLNGAEIDGDIRGLVVNGVEVAPLIVAELDRRYPERVTFRATTPEGVREAWALIESMWDATVARARELSEADLKRSVNDEWSFVQTLRHLIFVTDSWVRNAIEHDPQAFHPMALPASFLTDGETYGIDSDADPTFEQVLEVRAQRIAHVRALLAGITQDDLDRVREPNPAPGWPPPAPRPAIECLHVLFNEEWAHHQFAVRDLAVIEAG
jgi:hypothetical protein